MKILILTGYDDRIQELGSATDVSKRAYAERHGYDFHCKREYNTATYPSWQKIAEIRRLLPSYDAVVWFDSDTVITNCDVKIEDVISGSPVTISQDWCAPVDEPPQESFWVSCGNFIVRNLPETFKWLDMVEGRVQQFGCRPCWEQESVIANMRQDQWFRKQMTVLPRRKLNAVPADMSNAVIPPMPWQPGDFLCHLTGFEFLHERISRVPKYHAIFLECVGQAP